MTKEEATEILCYIAQDFLEPLALSDDITEELRHTMCGDQFNALCKFIHGKVKENENHE